MYRLGQPPEGATKTALPTLPMKSEIAAGLVRTNPILLSKEDFKTLPKEMQAALRAGDVEKVATLLLVSANAAGSGTAGSDFISRQFKTFADTVSNSMGGWASLPDGTGADGAAALAAVKASQKPDVVFYQISLGDDPPGSRTKASILGALTGSLAAVLIRETAKLPPNRTWMYVSGGALLLVAGLGTWWYLRNRKT